jgi:hypothetical protein
MPSTHNIHNISKTHRKHNIHKAHIIHTIPKAHKKHIMHSTQGWFSETRDRSVQHSLDHATLTVTLTGPGAGLADGRGRTGNWETPNL